MVEKLSETLTLIPSGPILVEQPREYIFELHRKATSLGGVPINQFWMPLASVYGKPNQASRNQEAIVDYFWARCTDELSVVEEDVQGSFLLAKLFPITRQLGSRRVVRDAVLTLPYRMGEDKEDLLHDLDERLEHCREGERTMIQFRDATADLLGPLQYDDAVAARYLEFEQELLGPARIALQNSDLEGLREAREQWSAWMRSIGRRRNKQADKLILDILSYESRAALHRCYSATWVELLPHLANRYGLSEESQAFHRLWHLDQCVESNQHVMRFHLFHGHVLGLHPAASLFIRTKTGNELIGAAIQDPTNASTLHRLLNGLLIAIDDYVRRSEVYSQERKRSGRFVSSDDIEAVHHYQLERSRGHRHQKKRLAD